MKPESNTPSRLFKVSLTIAFLILVAAASWIFVKYRTNLIKDVEKNLLPAIATLDSIQNEARSYETEQTFLQSLTDEERTWLRNHPVISVVQDPGWPPVEFADNNGEPSGMTADYLRLIEQRLGMKFELVKKMGWPEAYQKLKNWEIDMTTSVAKTSQRSEFWAFTSPYLTIPIVIATQSDVTYISDLEELAGKKVAVVDGYAVIDWITRDAPGVRLVRVQSAMEGLHMVQHGEAFAYIDNLLIIGYYQAKLKISNIKIAGQTPYVNAQCMAVRKDWTLFAGILQKALDSISEEERMNIYRKWVPVRYEYGFNYTLLWQVLAVFSVIFLALALWNRKLAKEIQYRRLAENALRENKARLDAALASMTDAVFISDADGNIIECNDAFATFHRFGSKSECIMKLADYPNIFDVFMPNGEPAPLDMWAVPRALRGETVINAEYSHRRKETGETWIGSYSFSPIRNSNGAIVGSVVVGRDITAQRNLEEQLRQALKMESVGRLAGGVAHDYNNMLNVILGYTEMAMEMTNHSDQLYEDLKIIYDAAKRSTHITRQLLAFARKQTVDPRVLDLNETVEGMLKMLRRLIGEDIDLAWLPTTGLWPVKIDPVQVDQILANLCVNARDAITDVGKVTIETENIYFDEEYCADHVGFAVGEFVMLAISDDGCGMDKETLDHVFEPFFTTKDIGKGTGMGLATVYGIVKQNNGFINIYSEKGKGTTLRLYLPRHMGDSVISGVDTMKKISQGYGETLMIVEDDKAIRMMSKRMLENLGYRVLEAGTPSDALRMADEHAGRIDLLITDVVMPEMNGRNLAERLNERYPHIKILYMSGYTANIIAHRGVLDKGVNFLQKPFSKKEMAEKVRMALKGRGGNDQ